MKRSAKKNTSKAIIKETNIDVQQKKIFRIGMYIRTSPNGDESNENSATEQKNKILAYIEKDIVFRGAEIIVEEYTDNTVSGMDLKRSQLLKLLMDIEQKQLDSVIITRIDRLSQKLEDLIYLVTKFDEHKINIISLNEKLNTQASTGKFFISILGSLAQLEHEKHSEEMRNTFDQLMQENSFGGSTPFGYLYSFVTDGAYTAYTNQNAILYNLPPIKVFNRSNDEIYPGDYVKYMFDWFISYNSISKVARRLNDLTIPIPRVIQEQVKIYQTKKENHLPTPKYILINKPGFWSRTTVRDILLNPFYTGIRVWNRFDKQTQQERANEDWIFLDNAHEKLIDEKTYILVTSLYEEIKKKPFTQR